MSAYFELRNISKTYDLHDDSKSAAISIKQMTIPLGGIIAIVGESGSGKTTLLNILGGLETPDWANGEQTLLCFKLADEDTTREILPRRSLGSGSLDKDQFPHRRVSYIFQQGYLLNQASIGINLAMTRRAAGLKADKAALSRLLDMAKLNDEEVPDTNRKKLSDRAITLSGGQQQRINIARAIGREPALLFADELTSSLDPNKASAVLDELRRWIWSGAYPAIQDRSTLTRSMIWVTHDYPLACQFADAVIVLTNGSLARNCCAPVELRSVTSSVSSEELRSWVSSGEVPEHTPVDESIQLVKNDLNNKVANEQNSDKSNPVNSASGAALSAAEAAIGNMASGIALSWMEAFQEKPKPRLPLINMVRKSLKPLLGYSHWVRAVQMGAVLALLMIITYGQREVIGYFDKQLDDPSLRHVIVQQNSREMQRSLISDESLAQMSVSLGAAESSEQLAFGRFTENVDAYPKGSDRINSGFIAEIAIGILDADEPVYSDMSVTAIDPLTPHCFGNDVSTPAHLIPYADELAIIVSKKYLEDSKRMFEEDLCGAPYLDLWDAGEPRSVRIVGFVESLPADGYDNFDAVMQTDVWRSWTSLVGKHPMSTFSRAAVYFTQSNYSDVMSELNDRSFAFDQEIVSKFERLINTAAQLRNTFLVITWLSLMVATTVAAGLIWGYLVQNAKSIAVLRAHDAWLWPLVAAIPFQLLLTFGYGLAYVAMCVALWNSVVGLDRAQRWMGGLTGGAWEPSALQWVDLSPTLPWIAASFLVMILVGWSCLIIWRFTHRELADELRQAY